MGAEVIHLHEDVLFRRGPRELLSGKMAILLLHDSASRFGVAAPRLNGGQPWQAIGVQEGLDRAALRMAADHDVADAEQFHRILDRGNLSAAAAL